MAADGWKRATVCPGWCTRSVALHILDDDLGLLSRDRDGDFAGLLPASSNYAAFVEALNRKNQRWVEAASGLSPRLICQLPERSGRELNVYYASLDLSSRGGKVSWASDQPVPVWLTLARDSTERWVHQQQIL